MILECNTNLPYPKIPETSKSVMLEDECFTPEKPKRNIWSKTIGNYNLTVASPGSCITPIRKKVEKVKGHYPECVLKVQRTATGKAKIVCPKKWKSLETRWICYWFISHNAVDGRWMIYRGRTGNLYNRLATHQTSFNNKGGRKNCSLAQAFRQGCDVYYGVLHIARNNEELVQWETSFEVQSDDPSHGKSIGNGDPSIISGSPLKDGTGGIPSHIFDNLKTEFSKLSIIEDPVNYSPKVKLPVKFNKKTQKYTVDMPEEWAKLTSVVYEWQVDGKKLEGETGQPLANRVKQYLKKAEYKENKDPISKAIRKRKNVTFAPIGQALPSDRKVWESYLSSMKKTMRKDGGLNYRQERRGEIPTTRLYSIPDPLSIPHKYHPQSQGRKKSG